MERFAGCSIFTATYLGNEFVCPIYPWEALEPYWYEIAMGITKILVYYNFSSNCYKDHNLWRQNHMGLEALRFADLMSRDLGVRSAMILFNRQTNRLKYGEWLEPFKRDTPEFWNQLAQFGQTIWNAVNFLVKKGYLVVHRLELGAEIMRPYWSPVYERKLVREWLVQTFQFMLQFQKKRGKTPTMKQISEYWNVPRYTLIEADLTREIIRSAYRNWKKTGRIKVVKPKRELKLITEEEQRRIAENIVKRVTYGKEGVSL